ncbi:hypothetical protein ACFL0D_08650 [Thermoproteota archaeon]
MEVGYIFAFYQMIGLLVKEQAVSVDIVYDDLGYGLIVLYQRYEPVVKELRKRMG